MSDLNTRLEQFRIEVEKLNNADLEDFGDFECAYCSVINMGVEIRNYIIKNPLLCDEFTLKFLKNQSHDPSMLADQFKCLYSIITLTGKLLQRYAQQEKICEQNGDFQTAIQINEQMFKFTGNYFYYIDIANIYNNHLNEKERCFKMYLDLEKYLSNSYHYWWRFAILYENREDYFNALLCMQKAIKLELNYIDSNKEVQNA